jgi:hypothetical protein
VTTALQLPVPLATASGWRVADFRKLTIRSQPATLGTALAVGPQIPSDELWLIDHSVTSCTSLAATTFRVYDGSPSVERLWDGSNRGNFDVGDWPAGLVLQSGEQLFAVWSGADDGAVGTVRIQARVMRQG